MNPSLLRAAWAALPLTLAACGSMGGMSAVTVPDVPPAVAVPAGNKPVLSLKGAGLLTYECRAKDGTYAWTFVGPDATLFDTAGKPVGKYYGGPTWEHGDGSKVTGKQLAVAPAGSGNIPLQLVQANPATGSGALVGVTYIQRVNTQGGIAPAAACGAQNSGTRMTVSYAADYIFYKSAS